jgi:alpha-tubulin suppressor-like RCC1 family protein
VKTNNFRITEFSQDHTEFLNSLSRIETGPKHCIGIDESQQNLHIWGETYIQTCSDPSSKSYAKIEISSESSLDQNEPNTTPYGESLLSCPFTYSFSSKISQISLGFDHTLLCLQNSNSIYSQGIGKQGELGLGDVTKCKIHNLNSHLAGLFTKIDYEFECEIT